MKSFIFENLIYVKHFYAHTSQTVYAERSTEATQVPDRKKSSPTKKEKLWKFHSI
jgi:hypothetical protein